MPRPKVDPTTLQNLNAHQLLSFRQWIALVGVSQATGWRLLHSKRGPRFIRVGEKKIGIRVADHVAWADKHAKASA
jgi:predicted DNA-binding transcriptional regulator AlpA